MSSVGWGAWADILAVDSDCGGAVDVDERRRAMSVAGFGRKGLYSTWSESAGRAFLSVENGVLREGSGRAGSRWREIKLNRGFAREDASVGGARERPPANARDAARRTASLMDGPGNSAGKGRLAIACAC